ncbi:hypothetical protein E2C01_053675 [Portunus trituberculatus]|uniref:Uncharacterized protein n=1 Tax=Portunus trituberculatus TaxID=210409 RepID=A0A5B7GHS9_PORTR|nr:hypothetical protein [Portunus trituberculatus]
MHTKKKKEKDGERERISFVPASQSGNGAARDDEGSTSLIPEMCVPQRVEDEHFTEESATIYKVIEGQQGGRQGVPGKLQADFTFT